MLIPGFLISMATFPGVIVHELAHVVFCKFTGTRVLEVCYFRIGNPAGYVIHEQPSTVWRHILIGVGPFFVNTLLGFMIGIIAIPMHMDFEHFTPVQMLLLWFGISIAMHSFPSTGDARSIWHAVWSKRAPISARVIGAPLVAVIFAGAVGSIFWLDAVYGIGIVRAAGALDKKLRHDEATVVENKRVEPIPNQSQTNQTQRSETASNPYNEFLVADFLDTKKQAENGNPTAQLYLANFYREGWVGAKDYAEALKWALKAAYNGLHDAQMWVAHHYQFDEENSVEAYAWLNLAAITDKKAAEKRDDMEKSMAKWRVRSAQQRSREISARIRLQSRASGTTSGNIYEVLQSMPTTTPYNSEKLEQSPQLARADQITEDFIAAAGNCAGFKCEDSACHSRRLSCMKRASAVAQRLLDTPPSKDQPRKWARAYIDATQAYEE